MPTGSLSRGQRGFCRTAALTPSVCGPETAQRSVIDNGEIYNFREIARTLEGRGVSFRTQSDSEVLLQAYIARAADACARFDGIFAFGIWDAVDRVLFLARDHMGVKPFVYAESDGLLIFASALKAVAEHPAVEREIDLTALSDFLSLGYVLSPKTILRGVKKLPPASWLKWRGGAARRASTGTCPMSRRSRRRT